MVKTATLALLGGSPPPLIFWWLFKGAPKVCKFCFFFGGGVFPYKKTHPNSSKVPLTRILDLDVSGKNCFGLGAAWCAAPDQPRFLPYISRKHLQELCVANVISTWDQLGIQSTGCVFVQLWAWSPWLVGCLLACLLACLVARFSKLRVMKRVVGWCGKEPAQDESHPKESTPKANAAPAAFPAQISPKPNQTRAKSTRNPANCSLDVSPCRLNETQTNPRLTLTG